jgi:hypothetical protein
MSQLPDTKLRYRSLKSNDETEFVFDTLAVEPITSEDKQLFKIYLEFDYTQRVRTSINYTLIESFLSTIALFPYFMLLVLFLHSVLSFVIFYKDFSKMIQRGYFKSMELETVLRLQEKFARINQAIEGMDQFKEVIKKLNQFTGNQPRQLSLKEVTKLRAEMEEFDTCLPNFDELEVSMSFKDELKKASQQSRKDQLMLMLQLTLNEIVILAKERVSPVGIYNLYDKVEEDFK